MLCVPTVFHVSWTLTRLTCDSSRPHPVVNDGRNVVLIDKCFMVCSIVQRRIKLLFITKMDWTFTLIQRNSTMCGSEEHEINISYHIISYHIIIIQVHHVQLHSRANSPICSTIQWIKTKQAEWLDCRRERVTSMLHSCWSSIYTAIHLPRWCNRALCVKTAHSTYFTVTSPLVSVLLCHPYILTIFSRKFLFFSYIIPIHGQYKLQYPNKENDGNCTTTKCNHLLQCTTNALCSHSHT